MRPVKCTNEHFFDADKFQKCPQCGADMKGGSGSAVSQRAPAPKTSEAVRMGTASTGTFGIFDRSKKAKVKTQEKSANPVVTDNNKPQANIEQIKMYATNSKGSFIDEASKPDTPQVDVWNCSCGKSGIKGNFCSVCGNSRPVKEPEQPVQVEQPVQPVQPTQPVQPVQIEQPAQSAQPAQPAQSSSLLDEIKKSSADNGGKTVGFFSANKPGATANSGSSSDSAPAISDPVVGWLVCTKGVHFGESFPIYSGRNSIGRNSDNRISLSRDNSVSREKHCWIVYEPRKRKFLIQPGDSSGLVYVDDENIMAATEINDKGLLELGNTSLMLVALCGPDFSWEDVQNN